MGLTLAKIKPAKQVHRANQYAEKGRSEGMVRIFKAATEESNGRLRQSVRKVNRCRVRENWLVRVAVHVCAVWMETIVAEGIRRSLDPNPDV